MTSVSAPGKVLLAGGYLVVDRAYKGIVLGLSARIHVIIRGREENSTANVIVRSPQFQGAKWEYQCQNRSGRGTEVSQIQK